MHAEPTLAPLQSPARQSTTTMRKTKRHLQWDAMDQVQVVAWLVFQYVVASTVTVTTMEAVALRLSWRLVPSATTDSVHALMQPVQTWEQTSRNF